MGVEGRRLHPVFNASDIDGRSKISSLMRFKSLRSARSSKDMGASVPATVEQPRIDTGFRRGMGSRGPD